MHLRAKECLRRSPDHLQPITQSINAKKGFIPRVVNMMPRIQGSKLFTTNLNVHVLMAYAFSICSRYMIYCLSLYMAIYKNYISLCILTKSSAPASIYPKYSYFFLLCPIATAPLYPLCKHVQVLILIFAVAGLTNPR